MSSNGYWYFIGFVAGAIMAAALTTGCAHTEAKLCGARFEYSPLVQAGMGRNARGWYVYGRAQARDDIQPCGRVFP